MTLHQVNADGAGPYACMVDPTATGESFEPMLVSQNVPGENGRERGGQASDFALVAQMPEGMVCTGTAGVMTGVCMVRCQNPARAGPFGGCVPVQMVAAAGVGAVDPPAAAGAAPPAAAAAVVAPPLATAATAAGVVAPPALEAPGSLVAPGASLAPADEAPATKAPTAGGVLSRFRTGQRI